MNAIVLLLLGTGIAVVTICLALWTAARNQRDHAALQPAVRGERTIATMTVLCSGLCLLALAAAIAPVNGQGTARPVRCWLCLDRGHPPPPPPPAIEAVLAALPTTPVGVIFVSDEAVIACPPTLDHEAVRDILDRHANLPVPPSQPRWEAAVDLVASRPGPALCLLFAPKGNPDGTQGAQPGNEGPVVATIDSAEESESLTTEVRGLLARAEANQIDRLNGGLTSFRLWLIALALFCGACLWWRQP